MKKSLFNLMNGAFFLLFLCLVTGCTKKESLYNPDYGKQPLPDPNDYFDFSMRTDVDLYVDYGITGFKALIEIYDEDPLVPDDSGREKKEGLEALFKIYTDYNGKFEGKMNIPATVKSVYLYTSTWGLPGCVKLDVENGAVSLDMSGSSPYTGRAVARSYDFDFGTQIPYQIENVRNIYSLCTWEQSGNFETDGYVIETVNKIGNETMQTFAQRMQDFFVKGLNNSEYIKGPETTNLHLAKPAKVNIIFVNKDASWQNTFGYYYYKEGSNIDVKKIRKYIVFPNVDNKPKNTTFPYIIPLKSGYKVKLQYFGEDGKGPASDEFPEGCTIGWFIYAGGFNFNPNGTSPRILEDAQLHTTNDQSPSYVTLADKKSGKLIIGVEDGGNSSFCDLLFYTEATPEEAVQDPDRPTIPDEDKPSEPEVDATENTKGTLAFEDVWPTGGDYDMNDVIVEYERKVSFNKKNMITKIEDTFKPVHDGATYTNAFAYQIDKGQLGNVTLPEGATIEKETSSIIVYPNNKTAMERTYTVTREFSSPSFSKQDLKVYNPYIIVNYATGENKRKEVHLPKYKATDLADQTFIGSEDDAYYLDKTGAYPFAIDIPIWNFKPVTETKHIDDEYSAFKKWANSKGNTDKDWYK